MLLSEEIFPLTQTTSSVRKTFLVFFGTITNYTETATRIVFSFSAVLKNPLVLLLPRAGGLHSTGNNELFHVDRDEEDDEEGAKEKNSKEGNPI